MGRRAESIVNVFCVEVVEREMRKEDGGNGCWEGEGYWKTSIQFPTTKVAIGGGSIRVAFPCTVLPESGASMVII